MKGSGDNYADRIDFAQECSVIGAAFDAVFAFYLIDNGRVRICDAHHLNVIKGQVFLQVEPAQISDADDTDLQFLIFRSHTIPAFSNRYRHMQSITRTQAAQDILYGTAWYRLSNIHTDYRTITRSEARMKSAKSSTSFTWNRDSSSFCRASFTRNPERHTIL